MSDFEEICTLDGNTVARIEYVTETDKGLKLNKPVLALRMKGDSWIPIKNIMASADALYERAQP